MRRRFRRARSGGVEVVLAAAEAAMLGRLCEELASLLDSSRDGSPPGEAPADPVLTRLFPRAYLDPTAEEAEAEWQRLVHPDLVDARRKAVEVLVHSLGRARSHRGDLEVSLSEEEAEAWLSVLNDARLALGTRLDVTEDLDPADLRPDDPAAGPLAVYWWLGSLEQHLLDALMQ